MFWETKEFGPAPCRATYPAYWRDDEVEEDWSPIWFGVG
jgi:hypothetical protein